MGEHLYRVWVSRCVCARVRVACLSQVVSSGAKSVFARHVGGRRCGAETASPRMKCGRDFAPVCGYAGVWGFCLGVCAYPTV